MKKSVAIAAALAAAISTSTITGVVVRSKTIESFGAQLPEYSDAIIGYKIEVFGAINNQLIDSNHEKNNAIVQAGIIGMADKMIDGVFSAVGDSMKSNPSCDEIYKGANINSELVAKSLPDATPERIQRLSIATKKLAFAYCKKVKATESAANGK